MNSYVSPLSRDPFRPNNYQNEMTLSYLRESRKLHGLEGPKLPNHHGGGGARDNKNHDNDDDDDDDDDDSSSFTLSKHKGGKAGKKANKDKTPITANLSGTRYEIVKKVAIDCGFEVSMDPDFKSSYLIWSDAFISTERISELKPYQRINHFPGMNEISRKDYLAKNMSIMAAHKPEDYNFVPKTWVLPQDYSAFLNAFREDKKRGNRSTYIVKPPNGAMGNGIRIYRNGEQIPASESCIVQEYIEKPFLIDGYKCDLRIYVLITSCDPMRVFIYEEGLLRLSTERYVPPSSKSSESLYMHLTNYSVNKHNDNYEKGSNEFTGSKRSFRFFNQYLRDNGCDSAQVWKNIVDLIVKTMILANPHVFHAYRICRPGQIAANDSVSFEVLGFDVILDHRLRPWLLEVNRSPSFGTDEELDRRVKYGVLRDSFRLINIRPSDKKRNLDALRSESQRRLFGSRSRLDQGNDHESLKRQRSIEKKKEELRDLLVRVRYDAKRDEFEAKHCGKFRRIFPVEDKFRQQHYAELMVDAFAIFNKKKGTSLQKEIQFAYMKKLKEDDIIEMMAEYESQESKATTRGAGSLHRGAQLNSSTRSLLHSSLSNADINSSDSDVTSDGESNYNRKANHLNSGRRSRPATSNHAAVPPVGMRASSATNKPKVINEFLERSQPNTLMSEQELSNADEENAKALLGHLKELFIKFPGKSQEEAKEILKKLRDDWLNIHSEVASYWLVKLDAMKRKRVIDIVRSNVTVLLQRVYPNFTETTDVRLNRIFSRLYNRMLWSQGQGLWDTFSAKSSWETMLVKSSEYLDSVELECCSRVVQLCQDCLLVVYQYAADSRGKKQTKSQTEPQAFASAAAVKHSQSSVSLLQKQASRAAPLSYGARRQPSAARIPGVRRSASISSLSSSNYDSSSSFTPVKDPTRLQTPAGAPVQPNKPIWRRNIGGLSNNSGATSATAPSGSAPQPPQLQFKGMNSRASLLRSTLR